MQLFFNLSRYFTFEPLAQQCFAWLARVILILSFISPVAMVRAEALPEVNKGLQWLQTQVLPDGSLSSEQASLATSLQARAEVLHTLKFLQVPAANYAPLQTALAADTDESSEYLARRAQLLAMTGISQSDLLLRLQQRQNADGGYGGAAGYSSHALDTALVLLAQKQDANPDMNSVLAALNYLNNIKSADGAFQINREPNFYVTAQVMLAASAWNAQTSTSNITAVAGKWLLTQKNADGHYGSNLQNAYAVLALLGQTQVPAAVDALKAAQAADGSWQGDPYLTALAVRALHAATQVANPGNQASVSGLVKDGAGAPLSGVTVQIVGNGVSLASAGDGSFSFSGVTAGALTLRFSKLGYAGRDVSVNLAAGQALNIGTVQLNQAALVASLSGTVSNQSGSPMAGVTVAVGTAATQTDAQGNYKINELSPGTATITASISSYQTASANVNFVAGNSYVFSPRLIANGGTQPATNSIGGSIIDAVSKKGIAGAVVQMGNVTQNTAANGSFTFNNITPGEFVLQVSANGYQGMRASGISVAGVNLVGNIALSALPSSSSLQGTVRDVASGAPLAGAKLSVQGQGSQVQSAADGQYLISGLSGTSFTLNVSADGYLSQSQLINLSQAGSATVDVKLQKQDVSSSDVSFMKVATNQTSYPASGVVALELVLANHAAQAAQLTVSAQVWNSQNNIVHEYLANPVVGWQGRIYGNNPVLVGANGTLELHLDWNTVRLPAGQYTIKARALDSTERLAAEAESTFTVEQTAAMAGGVVADPPLAQAGSKLPVKFSGDITNIGNLNLSAGEVQLKVILENPDLSESGQVQTSVRPFADGAPMRTPNKLISDGAGNLYTINYSADGKLIKIDSKGQQTLLATVSGTWNDLARDAQGNIWLAMYSPARLYKVTPEGGVSFVAINGLTQIFSMDLAKDGSGDVMLAGLFSGIDNNVSVSQYRLLRRTMAGAEFVLSRNGLSAPSAMLSDGNGNFIVSNTNDGSLVKVSRQDGLISPFVSGLNQPAGMTYDGSGNLYVVETGSNQISKVTADGKISLYASGLNAPYDLKFGPDGNLYVSNSGDDTIVRVNSSGQVQLFAKGVANGPRGVKADAAGNVWLVNDDGSLRKKDSQDNTVVVATGFNSARGLTVLNNGDVLVAEYSGGKITRVSNGQKSAFATGLNSPFGITQDSNGVVYVSENGAHRITRFDENGTKLGSTDTALYSPGQIRKSENGDLHIQNSGFIAVHNANGLNTVLRNFNYSAWSPDPLNGGYLVATGYSVQRMSASGVLTPVKSNLPFYVYGVTGDKNGNIFLLDYSGRRIQKLDAAGNLSVFADLGGYPSTYEMYLDQTSNDLLTRVGSSFVKVSADGTVKNLTPSISDYIYGWSFGGGKLIAWTYYKTYSMDINTGVMTPVLGRGMYNAGGRYINGAAYDVNGNLVLVDSNNHNLGIYDAGGNEIKQISGFVSPYDIVATANGVRFVDNGNRLYDMVGDAYPQRLAGTLPAYYLTQVGSNTYGTNESNTVYRWTGSGYESWYSNANVNTLTGIAQKANGNLVLANNRDSRVLEIDSSRKLVKDFAGLRTPQSLIFDASGRMYVANYAAGTVARFDSVASQTSSLLARVSSPRGLSFDSNGKLLVSASSGIYSYDANGVEASVSSGVSYKGIYVDNGTLFGVDSGTSQLMQLIQDSNGKRWQVFASGLAKPAALRTNANGDVFILNQNNNTLVKYKDGKLDTVGSVPSGMNAIDIGVDGALVVVGVNGQMVRLGLNGSLNDYTLAAVINTNSLSGVAEVAEGRAYILANDSNRVYEVNTSKPSVPPTAGTVVHTATVPMSELALDGGYQNLQFGSWVPPYGGDFRIELTRDGVSGKVSNFLHVGPNAQSQLSAALSELPPGDSQLPMCMNLKGADFTTISRVELGQVRAVSKSALTPKGMAGDRSGNLYVTDGTSLQRTTPSGQNTLIADGMNLAFGLAADSQENFYVASKNASTGRYDLLRIGLDGKKTVVADLGVSSANGVQVNSRDEILVGSPGKLLKVTQKGEVLLVGTTGLPSPRGIAIDGRDNVYVQNESHFVSMIKPDGSSVSIFSRGDGVIDPYFEGDGYPNIAADCADNFYIAPFNWSRINQNGEEYSIAQVVPRTGQIALLFDARRIDQNLSDIDYLAFDRFANRLLMWNHNDSRIWHVPVTCGAISVQAHLLAKSGQTLSAASVPPSASVPLADGRTEYVWSLRDVTAQGSQICFNAAQNGLQLGEERKSIDSGYISFQNSFAANEVQVPLTVPMVRAANLVKMNVMADKIEYPAQSVAQISTTLSNDNNISVSGDLQVQVWDAKNVLVGNVLLQGVSIAAKESLPVQAPFAIGTIVPAAYKVKAVLLTARGDVAKAETVFNVLPDNVSASAVSTLNTDRKQYQASDKVIIKSRVQSQSANLVLENLTVMIQVKDADAKLVFSQGHTVVQLLPGAVRDLSLTQTLSNVASGTYTVVQTLSDAQGRVYDQQQVTYQVRSATDSGFGLNGSLTLQKRQVPVDDMAQFSYSVSNAGNAGFTDLPLRLVIMDPAQQLVLAELPQGMLSLPQGQSSVGNASWITRGVAGQTLAVALIAKVSDKDQVLATDTFSLMAPLVKLSGSVTASPKQVEVGAAVILQQQVNNLGGALKNAQIHITLVDQNGNQVYSASTGTDLAQGAVWQLASNWVSNGNPGTRITVRLKAQVADKSFELGQDSFELIEAPVKLGLQQARGSWQNVLVYSSCKRAADDVMGLCGALTVPVENADTLAACDTSRAQALTAYLSKLGIAHKITTNLTDFLAQARSGLYNGYWLSNGATSVQELGAAEVKAALLRGDGLLLDGISDSRNLQLERCAGFTYSGKYTPANQALLMGGDLFETGPTLQITALPVKLNKTQATSQAKFGSAAGTDGILSNRYYGQANTLSFGFDLADTVRQQSSETRWNAVTQKSFDFIKPAAADGNEFALGQVFALSTEVSNDGGAQDVQLVQSLPPGTQVLATEPQAKQVADGMRTKLIWDSNLASATSQRFTMRLRVPNQAGSSQIDAELYAVKNGQAKLYQQQTYAMQVRSAAEQLAAIITAVNDVTLSTPEQAAVRQAVQADLNRVQVMLMGQRYSDALRQLLTVQSRMEKIDLTKALLPKLGRLVATVEWQTLP